MEAKVILRFTPSSVAEAVRARQSKHCLINDRWVTLKMAQMASQSP